MLLTGPSEIGKTSVCTETVRLAQQAGFTCAGVLSPARFARGVKVGIDLLDVSTGERRLLANVVASMSQATVGRFRFKSEALAWGTARLRNLPDSDLWVIDELGPLELEQGRGWAVALGTLCTGRFHLALVVVRPHLLVVAREKLACRSLIVWSVTSSNRDILPHRILNMLEQSVWSKSRI